MERKIETTPSELMKVLGGALLEQMHGEDPADIEQYLQDQERLREKLRGEYLS